jgi:hypothetical protein
MQQFCQNPLCAVNVTTMTGQRAISGVPQKLFQVALFFWASKWNSKATNVHEKKAVRGQKDTPWAVKPFPVLGNQILWSTVQHSQVVQISVKALFIEICYLSHQFHLLNAEIVLSNHVRLPSSTCLLISVISSSFVDRVYNHCWWKNVLTSPRISWTTLKKLRLNFQFPFQDSVV